MGKYVCGFLVACFIIGGRLASAQDSPSVLESLPLTLSAPLRNVAPQVSPFQEGLRLIEMQQWLKAVQSYNDWYALYGNKVLHPGPFYHPTIRHPPEPPAWLREDCPNLSLDSVGMEANACIALAHYDGDLAVEHIRDMARTAAALQEKDKHSSWLNHFHLDTLYSNSSIGKNSSRIYGLVGAHGTLPKLDMPGLRTIQIFLGPGVMLVRIPTKDGPSYAAASTFGAGFHMFDLGKAGFNINFVKAWVLGAAAKSLDSVASSSVDMFGLSINFDGK